MEWLRHVDLSEYNHCHNHNSHYKFMHLCIYAITNLRVMEWLRHVDLSEYAPNLRGSGVHGALLVFEAR